MLDICFSESFGDVLAQIKNAIGSDAVCSLDLHLHYGCIDGDVVEKQARRNADTVRYIFNSITDKELQKEYAIEAEDIRKSIKKLEKYLRSGGEIRLWLSNNANDRCGLYWLCDFTKDYTNAISVVPCPGYAYSQRTAYVSKNWASYDEPAVVAGFAASARVLNQYEKMAYAREWSLLVKENARLRILIDDTVVGVEESFFDSCILGFITPQPRSQADVMGKFLGKWQGGCDVAFLSMRIEQLISAGKVTVCEEKVDENDCYWQRTIALT